MRTIAFAVAVLLSAPTFADGWCMRLAQGKHEQRVTDPPGSFGPLHETMSLSCLRFVDVVKDGNRLLAVLLDEQDNSYRVSPGQWIGESSGRITEITEKRITLIQIIQDAKGKWVEVPRYLFRDTAK